MRKTKFFRLFSDSLPHERGISFKISRAHLERVGKINDSISRSTRNDKSMNLSVKGKESIQSEDGNRRIALQERRSFNPISFTISGRGRTTRFCEEIFDFGLKTTSSRSRRFQRRRQRRKANLDDASDTKTSTRVVKSAERAGSIDADDIGRQGRFTPKVNAFGPGALLQEGEVPTNKKERRKEKQGTKAERRTRRIPKTPTMATEAIIFIRVDILPIDKTT